MSILWHAAAAAVMLFLRGRTARLLRSAAPRRLGIAFIAAVVWLVHPVQSAAVAYVSGRADPLSATFGFGALFLGLRLRRARGSGKWWLGFGTALALLASALSKERA